MKISETFKNKRPVLSFEIYPPKKDSALKEIGATLEILSQLKPDYISVTFGAGGSSNNNRTIELARRVKHEYGVESVVHLTCLHYDKAEIDEFTKELNENGIENVLALRGDRNPNVAEKTDFAHASDLTSYLKEKGNFCLAGACYPEGHPESPNRISDIQNLVTKEKAGTEMFISQLFFDNELFYSFVEKARIAGVNAPISAGIMPIVNKAQIEKVVNLCGASIPDNFRKILDRFQDDKEALFDAGIYYAVGQIIDLLAHDVDGIHLYTMNNPVVAGRICDAIKNILKR